MGGFYPDLPSQGSGLTGPVPVNNPRTMAAPEMAYGVPMTSVVGNGFCVPYDMELIVKRKNHGLFNACFEILDANGNLCFQVDRYCRNFQKKRVLRDPAGFPILTFRQKVLIRHQRWTVHRGESSERKDFLCSARRSYLLPMKTRLDVFLASNIDEDVCNFQVVGSHASQSSNVYHGETVIAKVNHNIKWGSFCTSKESLRIKGKAGVDHVFIVALVVILSDNDMVHMYL